jgi:hypothetical protein
MGIENIINKVADRAEISTFNITDGVGIYISQKEIKS